MVPATATPRPPTKASVANGTATSCTGTANLTGVMVDDPLSLHGNSFETQTAINPVGVGYNPSSITFNGLTFTLTDFSQGGLTLSCNNAAATVTSGSTDNLSFGSCTFTPKIGSGTFSSSVQFPGTSLPFPIPVPFTGTLNSTSNGTYELVSGAVFDGDSTTIGITGTITATCSGCPSETLSPTTPLTFSAIAGGSAPASQAVTVSTGGTAEAYAVTTSQPWITVNGVSTTGGSTGGSFNVSVNPAGLAVGAYTGVVCVYSAASNSSYSGACSSAGTPTVTVNLTVTSSLVPAPTSLTFNSVNSAVPSTQTLGISVSPSSAVQFTATSNQSWLTVNSASTASGTTPGSVSVAANPGGLAGGTYSGSIALSSTTTGVNPASVPVTLNETTVPTPSALNFVTSAGINPPAQTLNVTSTAGPAVTYSAAVTAGNSWLAVSSGTFTTNGAGPTVTVAVGSLTTNSTGTITITPSGGAAIQVPVNLTFLPLLTTGSPSVNLTYTPGSSPSTALAVNSSNSTAISYSVSASSTGGNWLSVSPASGTTPGSVTVSIVTGVASTLATGTYSGSLLFTCTPTTSCGNASGQLSVPVTLTVTATLTAAPNTVQFNYTVLGSAPASAPIGVTSNGGAITYTAAAASSIGWLAVSPGGTITTPTGLTASVNASALTNLAPGSYPGTITLTPTGGSASAGVSPVTINATLVVAAALVPSSSPLAFTYLIGGTNNQVTQQVTITSNAATLVPPAQLSFTAAAASTGNWLSVSSPSGPTPQTLTVTVSPSALAAGGYSGTVTLTPTQAGSSPLVIPVNLTVTGTPGLTASPSSISTSYTIGGTVPTLPAVTISTDGSTPITGVSVSTATPWLKVSANSSTTPATMTVSLVQASIPTTPGPYSGSITIASTESGVTSLTYPVTLTVSPQPSISVTPTTLSFAGQVNGSNPAAQPISVTSVNGSVSFTAAAASSGNWLSVSSGSGTTNATLQISVNTKGLASRHLHRLGHHNGAHGHRQLPQTVSVSLNVTALPVLITTPTALSFSYTTGAPAPAGQSVAV